VKPERQNYCGGRFPITNRPVAITTATIATSKLLRVVAGNRAARVLL